MEKFEKPSKKYWSLLTDILLNISFNTSEKVFNINILNELLLCDDVCLVPSPNYLNLKLQYVLSNGLYCLKYLNCWSFFSLNCWIREWWVFLSVSWTVDSSLSSSWFATLAWAFSAICNCNEDKYSLLAWINGKTSSIYEWKLHAVTSIKSASHCTHYSLPYTVHLINLKKLDIHVN